MTIAEQIAEIPVFAVGIEPAREVVRVKPVGELDLATGPELRSRVLGLVAVGVEHLIIDLRGLSFIDATGLSLLLSLADDAREGGWRLSLIQGTGQVRRMFALTDIGDRLPFASVAVATGW
jgi:anti-sigma B factor antagonist